MSKVDIFFIAIWLLGLWAGYRAGLIAMLATLAAMLAGVWAIGAYSAELHQLSSPDAKYGYLVYLGLCLLVLAACLLAAKIFSWVAEKILKIVLLNWVNKGIGAFVGLLAGLVFSAFIAYTGQRVPVKDPLINSRQKASSKLLKPLSAMGAYLPGFDTWERWAGAVILLPPQSPEE